LYEKVVGCRYSCCLVVLVYYGLFIGGYALIYCSNGVLSRVYSEVARAVTLSFYSQVGAPTQSGMGMYEQIKSVATASPLSLQLACGGLFCFFAAYWWITCMTAYVYAKVRERYGIADTLKINICGCCLDLSCAYNFPCCIITQMARHLGQDVLPSCSCSPVPGGFWLWDKSSWPKQFVSGSAPNLLQDRHSPGGEVPEKHSQSRHSPRGQGPQEHPARHHHRHHSPPASVSGSAYDTTSPRSPARDVDWPEDNPPVRM